MLNVQVREKELRFSGLERIIEGETLRQYFLVNLSTR
jgi:hypothetical protein